MMLTGGIESDDGKNNSPPDDRGAAGDAKAAVPDGSGGAAPPLGVAAACGAVFGVGPGAGAGHAAEYRPT